MSSIVKERNISQEALKEIRPMLRMLREELSQYEGGHYRIIKERCGCALGTVSEVLNGRWFNKKILDVAIEYRDELRMKKQGDLELVKKKLAS